MLVLMKFTQKYDFGRLVAHCAYDLSSRPAVAADLIQRDMAREITAKDLKKLNAKVESLEPVVVDAAGVDDDTLGGDTIPGGGTDGTSGGDTIPGGGTDGAASDTDKPEDSKAKSEAKGGK